MRIVVFLLILSSCSTLTRQAVFFGDYEKRKAIKRINKRVYTLIKYDNQKFSSQPERKKVLKYNVEHRIKNQTITVDFSIVYFSDKKRYRYNSTITRYKEDEHLEESFEIATEDSEELKRQIDHNFRMLN